MILKEDKIEKITCPKCGREYLPSEIYIPDAFFGRPQDIDRTSKGKIESFTGKAMDLEETYICDTCKCKFNVVAKLSFKVTEMNKYDMSKYSTPLFEPKLTLFEGE